MSYEGCSFVDHASWWAILTLFYGVYPYLPDKLIRTEFNIVDTSIVDSVGLDPGTDWDGLYMLDTAGHGSSLVDRCRFERCGNFDENAVGQGGIGAVTPPGGSIVPSWEFSNSAWDGNAAATAPAFYMYLLRSAPRFS